jgi:cell division protein FtsL
MNDTVEVAQKELTELEDQIAAKTVELTDLANRLNGLTWTYKIDTKCNIGSIHQVGYIIGDCWSSSSGKC